MENKDDAEETLRPYMASMGQCLVTGFDAWAELARLAPAIQVHLSARTRASLISDHIAAAVRATFGRLPGVRVEERRGFPEVVIHNRFVLRFKKLDRQGRSRNILTKAQREWLDAQMTLPHMPPEAKRLIAGYVLDALGTKIERMLVTAPANVKTIDWMLDIEPERDSNIINMPRTPVAPNAPTVRSTKVRTNENEGDESA
jgi:hypothetical protein